ncbi:hypothetical protein SUNI508_03223 [Seiridium unicorne]|uniref:RNB domain-containing protein n=1 Tax=Seiridium unicorne TaxID=138068 RepID=A0ABR2VEL5_9PEZI
MLQASRSYVCWQCAARRVSSNGGLARLDRTAVVLNSKSLAQGQPTSGTRAFATVQHPSRKATSPGSGANGAQRRVWIRERLWNWEKDNPTEAQTMLTDYSFAGELSNSFTRPQNVTMAQFDVTTPLFEGDELSDLRSDNTNLNAGDLVEMSAEGSRRPMLAICLGRFNGYEHYYTSSGKWFTGLGIQTLFVVNNFVHPAELEPIISEIPLGEIPTEEINALHDLGHDPSRMAGAPLLKKMMDFTQEAEAIYQANAGKLDASSSFIGDPIKHRYLTLYEISDVLLPFSLKRKGKHSAAALYAVHRALLQDETFFRPLKQTGHRRSYLFEISPLSEVRIVQRVESIVRAHLEEPRNRRGKEDAGGDPTLIGFIEKARKAIGNSREVRMPSAHGVIGPSLSPPPSSTRESPQWSAADKEILQFIELWSSYQKFPAFSRMQTMGSTILRILDRYPDMKLDAATGWTFLQEVGWITPWDIQSRYNTRLPGVEIKRSGGLSRPFPDGMGKQLTPDVFTKDRKMLDNGTVYAIDAETTVDIDDAVSVEKTTNPEENWIHIHVADPASSISPDTAVAEYAELVPETIYLQGHYCRMLPNNISIDRFSLAPGRPCLTFSALVSNHGTVLKHKITPGTLGSVVYMTGEDVNEALGETREDLTATGQEFSIGPKARARTPNRRFTRPNDLTVDQKDELVLLSRLGKALHDERLKKGAAPFFQSRPSPNVSLDYVEQKENEDGFISVNGDPSIHISFSKRTGTDIVEHTMRLAGEIAARWCHDRGIPIPYRTQPNAAQNADRIRKFTSDVLTPMLASGQRPDDNHWRHLRALLGGDELTTTPGPHFTMGVDMYTKATSPLRRFGDLLVHWQIEAALLQEKKLNKSLVGNKDDSFLPFTRERLSRMLPMLRMRERQVRLLSNGNGADQWILQALVRAWKFGEAELPETFNFTVGHIVGNKSVMGRLDWFDRMAFMRADALNDITKMSGIKLNDVFEVKLRDVNVHSNVVLVEAVKLIKGDVQVPAPASDVLDPVDDVVNPVAAVLNSGSPKTINDVAV